MVLLLIININYPDVYAHVRFIFVDFTFIWSVVFFVSTTLILIFKPDRDSDNIDDDYEDHKYGLKEIYLQLWKILKIGHVRMICFIFLTCEVGTCLHT